MPITTTRPEPAGQQLAALGFATISRSRLNAIDPPIDPDFTEEEREGLAGADAELAAVLAKMKRAARKAARVQDEEE